MNFLETISTLPKELMQNNLAQLQAGIGTITSMLSDLISANDDQAKTVTTNVR